MGFLIISFVIFILVVFLAFLLYKRFQRAKKKEEIKAEELKALSQNFIKSGQLESIAQKVAETLFVNIGRIVCSKRKNYGFIFKLKPFSRSSLSFYTREFVSAVDYKKRILKNIEFNISRFCNDISPLIVLRDEIKSEFQKLLIQELKSKDVSVATLSYRKRSFGRNQHIIDIAIL